MIRSSLQTAIAATVLSLIHSISFADSTFDGVLERFSRSTGIKDTLMPVPLCGADSALCDGDEFLKRVQDQFMAPSPTSPCDVDGARCAEIFEWQPAPVPGGAISQGTTDPSPEQPVSPCGTDGDMCAGAESPIGAETYAPSPQCLIDPCQCFECKPSSSSSQVEGSGDVAGLEAAQIHVQPLSTAPSIPQYVGLYSPPASKDSEEVDLRFSISRDKLITAQGDDVKICNTSASRPAELWREAILTLPSNRKCSDAAEILLETREKYWAFYKSVLSGSVTTSGNKAIFADFQAYADACIVQLANIKAAAVNSLFGGDMTGLIAKRVGIISRPGSPNHCTASLVELGDERIGLATAAHCIGEAVGGAGAGRRQFAAAFKEMTFTTIAGSKFDIDVSDDIIGAAFDQRDDAVVLLLDGENGADVSGFTIANEGNIWEPIYIVGINPFIRTLKSALSGTIPELSETVSISMEPGCRAYAFDNRRIFHNCQTEQGMSGSPIFVTRGGSAHIIGVHSGEAPVNLWDVCGKEAARAVNIGTLLSK